MEQAVDISRPMRVRGSAGVVQVTQNGRPFYAFSSREAFTFTLPAGSYTLSGGSLVGRMPRRRGHRTPSQMRFPMPRKVRLVFAVPPPPTVGACISLPDGVIVCDPALRDLPSFCLTFVLFHEIGHYFYEDEESCDKFAAEEMHRRGFNPSQIAQASAMTQKPGPRETCNFNTAKALDNGR